MASNFTPHRISSPQLLEHVDDKVMYRFLQKHRDFFAAERVMPTGPGKIDYDRLSLVLAVPKEQMPAHLMADVFHWDEVSEMGQIENLVEIAEPRIVFYRPEAYDLLIYYHRQGQRAIYNDGNSVKERRAYCVYLGKNLFGDPDFFQKEDADKYTREPLRTKGRAAMDCTDVPGLNSARLTYLKYQFNGKNKHSVMHRAEDVFTGLEELGEAIPEEAELVCMGVKLTPTGGLGGERTVKLYAPNISVYDHESDAELAHDFLVTQEFIVPRNGAGQT